MQEFLIHKVEHPIGFVGASLHGGGNLRFRRLQHLSLWYAVVTVVVVAAAAAAVDAAAAPLQAFRNQTNWILFPPKTSGIFTLEFPFLSDQFKVLGDSYSNAHVLPALKVCLCHQQTFRQTLFTLLTFVLRNHID